MLGGWGIQKLHEEINGNFVAKRDGFGVEHAAI